MNRALLGFGLFAALALQPHAALAQSAAVQGVEFGVRAGAALPFGKTSGSRDLHDAISAAIPIQIEIGYRIMPRLMVGAFGQYDFVFKGDEFNQVCDRNGADCSLHDLHFGAQVHYHLQPDSGTDPWIGAGVAYESLGVSASAAGQEGSLTLHGFEFLNLQFGLDLKLDETRRSGISPFVGFSLGEYTSASCSGGFGSDCTLDDKALHEWLTLGIRGSYVL